MPFVRDFAYSYTTSTSGTTIVVPMPAYVQNDLLLGFITSDGSMPASTSAATATGWTHVGYWSSAGTTTPGICVLCKYAGASETDTTFTVGSADTINGTIISIGDTFFDGGTGINAIGAKTASTNVSNFTAARRGFPALTTTSNNSLIMYFCSGVGTGATGVASILEGPVHTLIGKDGTAHTDGCAWGFKATTGTIAANTVYAQVVGTASAAGFISQIEIKQPSGGATVIPTYIETDNCKLINIGTGSAVSTVYGNSTATAANATFTIGSMTLNGRPIVAGGTTYTYTDQGLNTYHSGIGILGVTTSNSWASNQTVHATMTDLADSNILLHLSPQLPIDIQTTDSMSLAGACGLGIGLASSAGNAKAWHVHGAGTPWGASRYVPVVINTGNTTGLLGTIGTLNNASITRVGLFLSGKTVAPKWTCKSIWKLDTTIVCGGNSSYPMTALDIIRTAADGKERRSVISQGNGQLLSYQVIQIGNGGTDPTYLDFAETAVEFPRQYNKSKKQINYCSIDNKCGVIFYPGASDTLDLRSSVFSSPDKYIFQFHASSSASATVLTAGMLVIGAGNMSLSSNVPISNASFTNCATVTQNSSVITSCIVTNSKIISATLADMDNISYCDFTSSGTGHAIEVSGSASTITFTGNTFTGYAATNGSTGNEAIYVNIASGTVTLNISAGSTPSIRTAGATVVVNNSITLQLTGLVSGSDIVILNAGTETERVNVDANVGTTYNYSFTTGGNVDICVYKQGYIPNTTRNYTLPASNGSLPIKQVADRNFSNP